MSIDQDLVDYRDDIASLSSEITKLKQQYQELSIELSAYETDETSETLKDTPPPPNLYEDILIPPPAKHSYFHASIARLFEEKTSEPVEVPESIQPSKKQRLNDLREKVLKQNAAKLEVLDNVLVENLYRMGGITAFPINNQEDDLLGIRIDILNRSKFLTPHYIILKKDPKNGNWELFKHTIPTYIPLNSLSDKWLNIDLAKFVKEVRGHLLKIQYKHDQLHLISSLTYQDIDITSVTTRIVDKVQKDLQCNRIELVVNSSKGDNKLQFEILCGLTTINEVEIIGINNDSKILCESMLRNTEFKNLVEVFRKAIKFLNR